MIQRYSAEWDGSDLSYTKNDGKFVLYADHLAELAEKEKQIIDISTEKLGVFISLKERIAALTAELVKLRTMSTVEMMCENYNVKCHVEEWEARCLKAEAANAKQAAEEIGRLREELEDKSRCYSCGAHL